MKKIIYIILLILLLSTGYSFSYVNVGGIITEEAHTLAKREHSIEIGLANNRDLNPTGIDSDTTYNNIYRVQLNVRLGFSNYREAGIKMVFDSQENATSENGLSEMQVNIKTRLYRSLFIKLLMDSAQNRNLYFSKRKTAFGIDFLIDVPFDISNLHINIGYLKNDSGEYKSLLKYKFAYNYQATPVLAAVLEVIGSKKRKNSYENYLLVNFGIKREFGPGIELIGSVGAGIQDGAPAARIYLGLKKEFRTKNRPNFFTIKKKKDKKYIVEPGISVKKKVYSKDNLQSKKTITNIKVCPVCGYKTSNNEDFFCPYDGTLLENAKTVKQVSAPPIMVKKPVKREVPEKQMEIKPVNINKVIDKETKSKIDDLFKRAKSAFGDGSYEKATVFYNEIIKLDERNGKAYYNLGVAYYFLKKFQDAKRNLEKSAELNPDDIDVYLYLAPVNNTLGLQDEAIKNYEKVLQIDPDNKTAKFNLKRLKIYK